MTQMIALSGAQGSGKDSVGEMLAELGFKVVALADTLKNEVAANWCMSVDMMFGRLEKDSPNKHYAIMFSTSQPFVQWFITSEQFAAEKRTDHYPLLTPRTPRELLLIWSKWRKSVMGDDVFIIATMRKILAEGFHHNIAITDARLPLEQTKLRLFAEDWHYRFQSWEIARPGYDYSNRDQYDTRLPDELIDLTLTNNRTLDDLKPIVESLVKTYSVETVK